VAMRQAALVSDESALEACLRRCAIQIDDLYLYLFPPLENLSSVFYIFYLLKFCLLVLHFWSSILRPFLFVGVCFVHTVDANV